MSHDDQLSPNFHTREFLSSDTADRRGIDNYWRDPLHRQYAARLAHEYLEPLRAHLGGTPIRITSGYRVPELNEAVGGAPSSAHIFGMAVDLVVPGLSLVDTVWAMAELRRRGEVPNWDQLILEYQSWIHLGTNSSDRRCQVLNIDDSGSRRLTLEELLTSEKA
jgi:hypothetical protein